MVYIFMSLVISQTGVTSNNNLINHIFENLPVLGEDVNDEMRVPSRCKISRMRICLGRSSQSFQEVLWLFVRSSRRW